MKEKPKVDPKLGIMTQMTLEEPAFSGLLWKMSPASFAQRLSDGQWVPWPYLQLLSRKLIDVATGRCKRLIITMPPRHGKSLVVSQWFPAWFLENWPNKRVILCSYEADFAVKWGGKVRDIIWDKQDLLTARFKTKNPAMHSWELEQGGGMTCAGAGGPITGKGADLLIIDDPVKNPVSVETPITMGNGSIKLLKDVVVGDSVITHRGRPRKVTSIIERGTLPSIIIKTFSRRYLTVANSHPCLTLLDDWKLGEKILVGDYLCFPRNYVFDGQRIDRTCEEAKLSGYLIGDGCCTNGVDLGVSDDEERRDVELCAQVIGLQSSSSEVAMHFFSGREEKHQLNARQWSKEVGLFGKRAYTKTVPDWVFSSERDVVANFLGAYFTTDGCITSQERYSAGLSGTRAKAAGCKIQFDSASKKLLEGVRELLLRFGVYAYLRSARVIYRGTWSYYWSLHILGQTSCLNFLEQIPIHHSEKRPKFEKWVKYARSRPAQTSIEILRDIKDGAKFLNISPNALFNLKKGKTSGEKYSSVGERYIYDRVVSVEPTEAVCRCISVEEDSSFLANGLIVHNSEEADSLLQRDKLWEWWLSTARTRLEPGASAICMATRWHSDDLIGRLINPDSYPERGLRDEWSIYNFPALAEPDSDRHYLAFGVEVNNLRQGSLASPLAKLEDESEWQDALGRRKGQALCPDRYNEDDLAKIRGGSSEKVWFSLYQQRPGDEAASGNVYHCFDEKQNGRQLVYNDRWQLFFSMDFNVDPMCVVIGQYDNTSNVRMMDRCEVLEEIILMNSNTYSMMEVVLERLRKYRRGSTLSLEVYGDAAGTQRTTNSKKTNWQIVAEHLALDASLHFRFIRKKDNPNITDRVNAVNGMLRSADGTSRLFVDLEKCPELVRDFHRVQWMTDSGGNSTGLLDKKDKKRTHISDALGYAVEYRYGMKSRAGGRKGMMM